MTVDLERIRAAYEAANEGDVGALTALFTPETIWCGVERGVLWWKRVPS